MKTWVVPMAAGVWLVAIYSAFGGRVSPFDALADAPTPAEKEALMQEFRSALPPLSNPITTEEREGLIQRFLRGHNPAIVEVLGSDLIIALSERFREVAATGGSYFQLRDALIDAVERANLPEEAKATGRGALLEGLNSPEPELRHDTMIHFAYREKELMTDSLLRMVDHPDEHDRTLALELLGDYGRPEAAPVIAEKLQRLANRSDRKVIENDFTFQRGLDAIVRLTVRRPNTDATPSAIGAPKTGQISSTRILLPPRTPEPTTPPSNPASAGTPAQQAPSARINPRALLWPWFVGIAALIALALCGWRRKSRPSRF